MTTDKTTDLLATVPAKERERIAESARRWANTAADLARSKAITDEGATENDADKAWRIAGNEAYHATISHEVAAYHAQHTPAERVTEAELAEIEERTSGPGPLAGDGPSLRRLAAEVRALHATVESLRRRLDIRTQERDSLLAARPAPATEAPHGDDPCAACSAILGSPQSCTVTHDVGPGAYPVDASLEARAKGAWIASEVRNPNASRWDDLEEAERCGWLAVVRAVDTSRPALTEEEARAWVVCNGWTDGDGRHAPIVSALLAASRGDIPADVRAGEMQPDKPREPPCVCGHDAEVHGREGCQAVVSGEVCRCERYWMYGGGAK